MKVTFEQCGLTVSLEDDNAEDVHEATQLCASALLAQGYHLSIVVEAFAEYAKEQQECLDDLVSTSTSNL